MLCSLIGRVPAHDIINSTSVEFGGRASHKQRQRRFVVSLICVFCYKTQQLLISMSIAARARLYVARVE